jgi:hypothetical protein
MTQQQADEIYPQINFEAIDIMKQCAGCKQTFTEKTNIGQWECSQHFGTIENGKLTCCNISTTCNTMEEFYDKNLSSRLKGCVKCDHRIYPHPYNEGRMGKIRVPRKYLVALSVKKDAIELTENMSRQTVFTVLRYDRIMTEKLRRRMYLHLLATRKMANPKYILKHPLI